MNIKDYFKDTGRIGLSELYTMYKTDMYRYAMSLLKNKQEAEDAVHEVFAKYSQTETSFKGDCSYKTWLMVLTRNYCYNRLSSMSFTNTDIDIIAPYQSVTHDFDTILTMKEALSKISPEYNELIYLKEYDGFSYKEIADLTHLSIENVKIKLFRARQELRNYLKGEI